MREYYCWKSTTNDRTYYRHIYTSRIQLRLCGISDPVIVHVVEDQDGDYWGWLDNDDDYFSMIYPSWDQFDMCFAYGSAAAVEAGRGRVVKLRVTEVDLK